MNYVIAGGIIATAAIFLALVFFIHKKKAFKPKA
jgi:hypothetical protein